MYKNQKGRFIIEMLVILALLAIFSPMIYTAQLEKQQKEINLNNANQISEVANSVRTYILKNLDDMTKLSGSVIDGIEYKAIDDAFTSDTIEIPFDNDGLANYLPPGLNSSAVFINKLFSGYKIGINRRKVNNDIIVSGMVIAIPKGDISFSRTSDITSMLGAAGGLVEDGNIVGNGGVWTVLATDFFKDTIPNNTIAANIDFIVPKQSVVSDGGAVEAEDEGFIHRDLTDTKTEEFKDIDGNTRTGNMATMQTNLQVGKNELDTEDDAKNRHGFKNVDAVAGGKALLPKKHDGTDDPAMTTCVIGSKNCLQRRFDVDMAGKNEFGATCGENEACISVNGPLETEAYLIRPAGTTVLDDVRIGKLAGVKLSELIPPMILLEVHRGQKGGSDIYMQAENCPTGYIPTATVVATKWDVGNSSITTSTAAWPFYAMNFKNNTNDIPESVGIWGSGHNCADVKLSDSNILAHYIDVDDDYKIKMRAYMGDATEYIGGNRPIEANASFTVTATSNQTFVDQSLVQKPNCSTGKLEISLDGIDRCGISNLSTAFACNKELIEVGKRDFNGGQSASLLRWEFYHPPEYMSENLVTEDVFGEAIPVSKAVKGTMLPSGKLADELYPDGIMQTRQWKLEASNSSVDYDVYIYCKYVVQAFE